MLNLKFEYGLFWGQTGSKSFEDAEIDLRFNIFQNLIYFLKIKIILEQLLVLLKKRGDQYTIKVVRFIWQF